MGFLKFLGKFFGSFLIVLALIIIFTGLTIQYSVENLGVISQSAQENFPKILQENKELLVKSMSEDGKINKAKIKDLCNREPETLPKDFCNRLNSMTEEEALEEFSDIIVLKIQDEYEIELGEGFREEVESQLNKILLLNYLKHIMFLALFIFLLGFLLIEITEKFDHAKVLSYTAWKTGVVSVFVAIGSFIAMNLTQSKVETLVKLLPIMRGEEEEILVVKLVSAAFTDWIRIFSVKIFYISLIITILSFLIVLVIFILRRKLKKKEEKPIEEKTEANDKKTKNLKSKKKK